MSGYWKGCRFNAVALYHTADGKAWCRNHLPVGQPAELIKKTRK